MLSFAEIIIESLGPNSAVSVSWQTVVRGQTVPKFVFCHVFRGMYKILDSTAGGCGSGVFPFPAPNPLSEWERGAGTGNLLLLPL